jgi:hypothetical protein
VGTAVQSHYSIKVKAMFDIKKMTMEEKAEAIKYCYQVVRDATWEKNLAKIEHYTKILRQLTDIV